MNKEQRNISYPLIFTPESAGGYTVTVPTLPGCITYGATFEEATANIREALLLCIEEGFVDTIEGSASTQRPILSSIEFSPEELLAHA